jgi:hypothetical protein
VAVLLSRGASAGYVLTRLQVTLPRTNSFNTLERTTLPLTQQKKKKKKERKKERKNPKF